MRAQLATPDEHIVTKNSYNELFTMHGTTMIFLVVVPVWAGLGNYLVPLMIGARDMAFPRLNALSYWLFLLGGGILYSSWFVAGGRRAGRGLERLWTAERSDVHARARDGLLDPVAPRPDARLTGGGDQLPRHDPPAARARHVVDARAAVRLGDGGLLGAARRRAAG